MTWRGRLLWLAIGLGLGTALTTASAVAHGYVSWSAR